MVTDFQFAVLVCFGIVFAMQIFTIVLICLAQSKEGKEGKKYDDGRPRSKF